MSKAVVGGIRKFGSTWWGGFILNAGISLTVGSIAARLNRPKRFRPEPLNLGPNGGNPLAILPVIYGAARVGVQRVYMQTTDSQRYLWFIGAIAHGPIAGIDAVYLDGNQVVDANGRTKMSVPVNGNLYDFPGYAHAWYAYGTTGQVTVVHKARGSKTVTGTARDDSTHETITTSAAHGYSIGDIVVFTGLTGPAASRGYGITAVPTSTTFTVFVPEGFAFGIDWSDSGSVDHFTPDLDTLLGTQWTPSHNGKGVAYVVLRLLFSEERFANGMPEVTLDVRGIAARDTRSSATISITSSAVDGAVTGMASTASITTGAAHGLAEGDIIRISGHSKNELNGKQRVDRVTSSTVFVVHTPLSGAGTGGTVEELTYSTNPAVCIRDYLTNPIYGFGCEESEMDDTAIEIEANHYDELVDVPESNTDSFTNQREILSAVGDGTNVTFTLATPHGYTVGQTIRVHGFSDADNLDGTYTIASLPLTTEVRIALARTGSWTPETFVYDLDGVAQTLNLGAMTVLTQQARYTCSGVITTDARLATLEDMLSSCRGSVIEQAGQFRISTRRAKAAVSLVLNEDTIVGSWQFGLPGLRDMANIVRASYRNAARGSQADSVEYPGPTQGNGFLEDDNFFPNRRDIDLPFTDNKAGAQQIAMITRRESRSAITCAVTCKEAALALAVDDVVQVTHPTPGWTLQKFWVSALDLLPNAEVRVLLQQYDETSYDLDANDDTPFAPDTTLELGPVSHTAVITHTQFVPLNSGVTQFAYTDKGIETTDDDERYFTASVGLPVGAQLGEVRVRVYRANSSSNVEINVDVLTQDGTATSTGTLTATTNGLSTLTDTLDYLIQSGDLIRCALTMESDNVAGGDAALLWVEIDYTLEGVVS